MSHNSFDMQTNVSHGCAKTHGIARFRCCFSMIHLPSTKVKGQEGEDIYLIDCPLTSSLINAFAPHLASSPLVPEDALLFAWQTANGGWCPMTKYWFMGRCRTILKKESLDLLDGHSFQIGGTTHHLMSRVDPWVVMVIGLGHRMPS